MLAHEIHSLEWDTAPLEINAHGKRFEVLPAKHEAFWNEVTRGEWEPQTFAIFERFLNREHSYIDIGAWIGPTLLFGCQFARAAYALEPDPIAYVELEKNVALNGTKASNVVLFNACIATHTGEAVLGSRGLGGDSTSSLLFARKKTHWTVKALTFADFVRQNNIDDCNFIKMDIEGGEYHIVPLMSEYLAAARPVLHLSLHPCYLKLPLLGGLGRVVSRERNTRRLLEALKFYRHIYDHDGHALKPEQIIMLCRQNISMDVVLTDRAWG